MCDADRECNPLKVPEDLRAAIVNSKHPFECPNCWSRTHRCFKCSKDFKLDAASDTPSIVKYDMCIQTMERWTLLGGCLGVIMQTVGSSIV